MDFLTKFVCDGGGGVAAGHSMKAEPLDEQNVELSLGLSSNGRFGIERRNNDRLIRASSIADFSSSPSATEDPAALTLYPPLTRTCSLPIETEVEWKKRKELQSLRRSEAKRKRVEKLKSGRVVKGLLTEENCVIKRRNLINGDEIRRLSPPSSSLLPPLPRPSMFPAQVSIGSPASGGSSGVSDLESQPFSGTNRDKDVELNSMTSQQSVSHQISSSILSRSNSVASEHASKKNVPVNGNRCSKDETLKMIFADMPCVSTKGDNVNGKKIEGFLYRYKKGEEVRIVCVCHGSFLTPAEFVKHGGGVDVKHPLRHIVVSPPLI